MLKYDFAKAKKIIEKNKSLLDSASLGLHEDWFWTAETVFEGGKFVQDLDNVTEIAEIGGSRWATPTLELVYFNGQRDMIDVSKGERVSDSPPYPLHGVLSGPVQENIPRLRKIIGEED